MTPPSLICLPLRRHHDWVGVPLRTVTICSAMGPKTTLLVTQEEFFHSFKMALQKMIEIETGFGKYSICRPSSFLCGFQKT